MKYDNSKTEELVKECYKEIDGITNMLRNMWSVSEFTGEDFKLQLNLTQGYLRKIKENLEREYQYLGYLTDLTLIALESYTEGKASWERAGEISGLGIFGLENYVNERGVDSYKLRLDPYLDFTGEKEEKIIREEWDKLMNYKEGGL